MGEYRSNINYYSRHTGDGYDIREKPLNTPGRVSVACIGVGVSGIAAAIRAQETLEECDFTIYEKNSDLGGTWLENRYPGCACDVPAHAYTYTFEPNPDYSRYYVGSVEIHQYLKAVAKKHKVERYIRYNHRLVSAEWNKSGGVWVLELEVSQDGTHRSLIRRECNVLINACGLLNNWKWPNIEGLKSFQGHLCHSAQWKDFEWTDKKIAVIGSGSSAIQVVPELQPIVGQMKAFIRSPLWIAPSQGFVDPKNEGPTNFYYTQEEKERFRKDPDMFLKYRKRIESDMNRTFDTFLKDGSKQQSALVEFAKLIKKRLGGDEKLAAVLTPTYGVGCRRLTPGPNFLETLVKDNVEVINEEVDHVEAKGLVTKDGSLHEVDAIICATGFDTTYKPRFKLVGSQGISLADLWSDSDAIEAYLAMAIPEFPSYFMFVGPNAPISNGTLIPVIEKQASYMMKLVDKMQRQQLKSFTVKPEVVRQLNVHHQKYMRRMVFSDPCRSWYKAGKAEGKVLGIWPGSSLHYMEAINDPRYEDYDYEYQSNNMWNYLGNGWTQLETKDRETEDEMDLAWYLIKPSQVLEAPGS